MHAALEIELRRAPDGSVAASGTLAATPFWCRWDGTTLWIVSSAAAPVGDDRIEFDLHVGEGVHAQVRTVAATLVYAARGEGTRLTTRLRVAAGATLIWQPEPVIVTARARHTGTLEADVAAGATLVADDLVVLGRSGEDAGAYRGHTHLHVDDRPVALTSFDTSLPGWSGPGGTGGGKVIGTRLLVGGVRRRSAEDASDDPPATGTTAVLRPEAGGAIATTLANDPATARSQLDAAAPIATTEAEAMAVA